MKKNALLACALISTLAFAETSTERANLYYKDLASAQYNKVSEHFEPEELKTFRKTMEFYKSLPEQDQVQFINRIFGQGSTAKSVSKYTDAEFFTVFYKKIMQQASVDFDDMEILGTVKEGENIEHLVTRNTINIAEVETQSMEVMTLRKSGDRWYIQMSGKVKGLPKQLKMAFAGRH